MSKPPQMVLGHGKVVPDADAPMGVYVHKESCQEHIKQALKDELEQTGEYFAGVEYAYNTVLDVLGLEDDDE